MANARRRRYHICSIQSRGHIAPLYIHRAQSLGRQYICTSTYLHTIHDILAAQNNTVTYTRSIQSRGHIAPLYIHRAQPLGRQYILARTQYILAAQNAIRASISAYLCIWGSGVGSEEVDGETAGSGVVGGDEAAGSGVGSEAAGSGEV